MEANLNWKQIAVLSFGVVMAAIVIVTHEEPIANADNSPERERVIRALVHEQQNGTYSFRQANE